MSNGNLNRLFTLRDRMDHMQVVLTKCWGDLISHMYQQSMAKEQGHVFDAVIQYDLAAIRTAWMDLQELHFELDQLFCPGKTAARAI